MLVRNQLSRPLPTQSLKTQLGVPKRLQKAVVRASSADVDSKKIVDAAADESLPDVQPSSKEVESFLGTLINHTSIAEMHLQVGTFELKVKRSTGAATVPAAPPPTVVIKEAPSPSPAETLQSLQSVDQSMDESLVYVQSPKVGMFTRGRYAGGKRIGKGNIANVGDQVKKGQVLGFVEQLGTYVPVESPQAGEITSFIVPEGAAVEYNQTIVEMAPFFGGHIIGDSKYA